MKLNRLEITDKWMNNLRHRYLYDTNKKKKKKNIETSNSQPRYMYVVILTYLLQY